MRSWCSGVAFIIVGDFSNIQISTKIVIFGKILGETPTPGQASLKKLPYLFPLLQGLVPGKTVITMKYLLGFDIGSSSIKAALVDAESGKTVDIFSAPSTEMPIDSPQTGFAEQHPDQWWQYVCECSQELISKYPEAQDSIQAIGLAFQMHGLVVVDSQGKVLRPSIIWCDSRAVDTGDQLLDILDADEFLQSHYNYPGNFTFSKLRWVQQHQPDLFDQIDKIMLPGDYIAYKMTGLIRSSISGLSEGIMWDFESNHADRIL